MEDGASKKGFNLKILVVAAILATVTFAVFLFVFVFELGKKDNCVLIYNKFDDTYVDNLSHKWEIEDIMNQIRLSYDNKRLFYLTNDKELKYLDLISKENEPVTIGKDVTYYDSSKYGDVVMYMNGNREFFKWVNGSSKKMDDDFLNYLMDNNGRRIIFETTDKQIVYDGDKKIYEGDRNFMFYTDDMKNIFFAKDNVIYKLKSGKLEEIYDHFGEFLFAYDKGFYFVNRDGHLCYYEKKVHVYKEIQYAGYRAFGYAEHTLIVSDIENRTYIVQGKKVKRAKALDDVYDVMLNDEETKVYYLQESAIMSYNILTGICRQLAIGVSDYSLIPGRNECIYLKHVYEGDVTATLYAGKRQVDEDVLIDSIFSDKEGNLIYKKPAQEKKRKGVFDLYLYNGKKSILITKNIHVYEYISDKAIYYVTTNGEMYFFNGKDSKLVETNVDYLSVPERESIWSADYYESNTLQKHFH